MQTPTLPGAVRVTADPTVFLMGRPSMNETILYLRSETLEGQTADVSELTAQWRKANVRIRDLAAREPDAADNPVTRDLPAGLRALGDAVLTDPVTKQSFGMAPTEIKLVQLDKLVVFQKYINVPYASKLQALLGDSPSEEDVFHFALPIDGRYDPASNAAGTHVTPLGPIGFTMVSPSLDYRVLNSALLDPSQVSGFNINGRATQIVALAVGYGSNLLSAMRVGTRLILKNGSHRAFALLASGQTHAPMLIENIPSSEESEHLPPDVLQKLDMYVTEPRPPMLHDYLSDDLRLVVHVPRKMKAIRVGLNYEEGGAPGV